MWELELWEFNACVNEYNKMQSERADELTAMAWQTANFTGAAFAGKLRKLNFYLEQRHPSKAQAPKISRDEFDKKLAMAERRLGDGS